MRSRLVAVVAVAALTVVSCAATTAEGSFDLIEFAVNGPAELSADPQTVTVTNSGLFPHTLVVTDGDGAVVAATPLIQSGEAADMTLDLEPGQYSFTCRIVAQTPDGDLVDHFEEGMARTVTVAG
jgi:plastocyanin